MRNFSPFHKGNPLARIYISMLLFDVGEGALRFLVPVHLRDLGFRLSTVGFVTSAFALATLASRIPTGLLYRPQRAAVYIRTAGLVSSLAFLTLPFASRFGQFVALMILDGVGWGVVTTILLTTLLSTRVEGMSTAASMGWYVGVNGLGHSFAALLGGTLADAVGVRGAFFVFAVIPFIATMIIGHRLPSAAASPSRTPRPQFGAIAQVRGLPTSVWIAFGAALYLNSINGMLNAFFPVLALGIGFSLTQAGTLASIRSGVSAVTRFMSIPVFERISVKRLTVPLLILAGTTAMGIGTTTSFLIQIPLWALNGVARGLVRVGTGTDAMDSLTEGQEGAAASVMSFGLDLGKVTGPFVAGLLADVIGLSKAFVWLPAALFAIYILLLAASKLGRQPMTT